MLNISWAGAEYCMVECGPVTTGPKCSAGDWVCQESPEIKPEVNKCHLCLLAGLTICREHGAVRFVYDAEGVQLFRV